MDDPSDTAEGNGNTMPVWMSQSAEQAKEQIPPWLIGWIFGALILSFVFMVVRWLEGIPIF
jgi:hypothetical protein